MRAGERKNKREMFWPPFSGPNFRGPPFSGSWPHPSGSHHDTHQIQIAKKWNSQNWIGRAKISMAKTGFSQIGLFRSKGKYLCFEKEGVFPRKGGGFKGRGGGVSKGRRERRCFKGREGRGERRACGTFPSFRPSRETAFFLKKKKEFLV